MLFWMSTVSSRSPVQRCYIILASKISTQRHLRQVAGLAEENVVIFDGFADNLTRKITPLVHYLLSNPKWLDSSNVFVREHFPPNTFSYFEDFEYNLISRSSIGKRYRSQNNGLKSIAFLCICLMIRFHHHSNLLNHIKIIFLCSCSSLCCSSDIAQETDTKLHFSIAFSIERSRNCAVFAHSDT